MSTFEEPFKDSTNWCLLDFDGTLAEIVPDPTEAEIAPPSITAVRRLLDRGIVVGIVSGRPMSFLLDHLPEDLVPRLRIAGSYGVEKKLPGLPVLQLEGDISSSRREAIQTEVERVVDPRIEVEWKPYSFTLHFRNAPEYSEYAETVARRLGDTFGLVTEPARMAFELFYQAPPDKGSVVEEWTRYANAVMYCGDDRSDLRAFDVLDMRRAQGIPVRKVAVAAMESPSELVARADVVVESVSALAELLGTAPLEPFDETGKPV
ncbi:MAG: trehalose-phosphatase [Acidimicrobiales bacterium]